MLLEGVDGLLLLRDAKAFSMTAVPKFFSGSYSYSILLRGGRVSVRG
jgi:hypothetical protein